MFETTALGTLADLLHSRKVRIEARCYGCGSYDRIVAHDHDRPLCGPCTYGD